MAVLDFRVAGIASIVATIFRAQMVSLPPPIVAHSLPRLLADPCLGLLVMACQQMLYVSVSMGLLPGDDAAPFVLGSAFPSSAAQQARNDIPATRLTNNNEKVRFRHMAISLRLGVEELTVMIVIYKTSWRYNRQISWVAT